MASRAYHGANAKFIYYALTHPSLLYDFFKLRKESSVLSESIDALAHEKRERAHQLIEQEVQFIQGFHQFCLFQQWLLKHKAGWFLYRHK